MEKYTRFELHRITTPASWQHWKVHVAFQALGPLGKPAIPELVKLAHLDATGSSILPNSRGLRDLADIAKVSNISFVPGEIAAWSLAAMGADGVPPLMELLDDPRPRLKLRAAIALGCIGEAAEPAVPGLVRELKNPAFEVRQRVADQRGSTIVLSDFPLSAFLLWSVVSWSVVRSLVVILFRFPNLCFPPNVSPMDTKLRFGFGPGWVTKGHPCLINNEPAR
jgi:hypothetical protein